MRPSLVAALAALAVPRQPALSQNDSVVVIPDAVECDQCAIVTRKLVTLGNSDGPGSLPGMIQAIAVDGRGRYWIIANPEMPSVYDASGRFVATVGRRGSGPGEFQIPLDAAPVPGDSMLVLDGAGRATVFDPELHAARTVAVTAGFFPVHVIDWPSSVVANGFVGGAQAGTLPLHRLTFADRAAGVLASFGPANDHTGPNAYAWVMQRISPAVGDGFWSADWARYRLTHWTAIGKTILTLERKPSWFLHEFGGGFGSAQEPPDPGISAILEDSTGLLWVFAKVPASTWRGAWPSGAHPGRGIPVQQIAHEKLFRTVIEVIDPRRRRVVARQTIPEYIVAALPGPRAAAYVVSGDGTPRIEILRLELRSR
jgi:hypothetical protein